VVGALRQEEIGFALSASIPLWAPGDRQIAVGSIAIGSIYRHRFAALRNTRNLLSKSSLLRYAPQSRP
jgi:hypothetical protein